MTVALIYQVQQKNKQMRQEDYNKNDQIDIKVGESKKGSKIFEALAKNIKIIVVLEIIIIFVFGYFFLLKAEFASLKQEKDLISLKSSKLEEIQKYQVKFNALKLATKQIEDKKNVYQGDLYDVLPQKQNLPEILLQVEALVNHYGLILRDIQISAPQNVKEEPSKIDNNIEQIEVSISVFGGTGSYDKLKDFLEGIEKHIRLFDVTSFSFDSGMTQYRIVFKTYYLKNEK